MKTVHQFVLMLLALPLCFSGCSQFEDINTNPNGATKVTAGMLATQLILPVITNNSTAYTRSKYMISIETTSGNMDVMYNRLGRSDFNNLAALRNVEKMIGFAPEGAVKNSYTALGHFIRARLFFEHTMYMGDMPYSEAIKGEEGVYYPAYDTQKDIFIGLLNELDEADRLFAAGAKFDGDPYSYGGDPAKWRKLVNAFELRVLINCCKRADDTPELRVKERFQRIASTPECLYASTADNYLLNWSDVHRYNYYRPNDNGSNNRFVTSIIIDTLKRYNDRRLYYYATPTLTALAQGVSPATPEAYTGVNPLLEINTDGIVNNVSRLNHRYTERAEGETTSVYGYVEENFILAEAAARGYISGAAKDYYEKAIRASMQYTADMTPDDADFHHNMKITDSYINTYLQSPGVAFANTASEQIHQILIQKFLDSFLRNVDNTWFEMRRTGYPAIPVNPATNLNTPNDRMPVRWMYPEAEYTYNGENVNAAVARQFGGTDDANGIMWILK